MESTKSSLEALIQEVLKEKRFIQDVIPLNDIDNFIRRCLNHSEVVADLVLKKKEDLSLLIVKTISSNFSNNYYDATLLRLRYLKGTMYKDGAEVSSDCSTEKGESILLSNNNCSAYSKFKEELDFIPNIRIELKRLYGTEEGAAYPVYQSELVVNNLPIKEVASIDLHQLTGDGGGIINNKVFFVACYSKDIALSKYEFLMQKYQQIKNNQTQS